MKLTSKFILLIFVNASFSCLSQQSSYEFSSPLDMEQTGVNKVLCMNNGSTMFFHFELNKPVEVKVFDSSHKQIASQKHLCRLFDISSMKTIAFKGLYCIGNEAVLFIEQEHLSKYNLIRMRFNVTKGELIDEQLVGESASMSRRTRYYVVRDKVDDSYAIFYCTDIPQFKDCKLNLIFYNNLHQVVKEMPLIVDRKQYDELQTVSMDWQPEGICITLNLKRVVVNGTYHSVNARNGDAGNAMSVINHDLGIFFIPKGGGTPKFKSVDVTADVYPYYTNATYNAFAKSLNVLMLSYMQYNKKFGIDVQPADVKGSLFLALDDESMALKYKWMKNEKANIYYKQETDSTKLFEGLPIKMFTNENGLSTVVFRSFSRYKDIESRLRPVVFDSYLGNICITQFDDDGSELWGTVLPNCQFLKSYDHYYFADELSRRWQDQTMFLDLPEQVYNRQFFGQNIYSRDRDFFIIYNDCDKNFNNSMKAPGDTVYSFDKTNTCYYKLNRKREISKHYLFGPHGTDEYNASFIEGADYDSKRNVYATLVQYQKGESKSLRMAWSHLE